MHNNNNDLDYISKNNEANSDNKYYNSNTPLKEVINGNINNYNDNNLEDINNKQSTIKNENITDNIDNNNNKDEENNNNNNNNNIIKKESNLKSKQQNRFKNIFNSKSNFSSNTVLSAKRLRNILLILSVTIILMKLITLEIQCLFLNICYGEDIELEYWLSQAIVPSGITLILITVIFYLSIEYIVKVIIFIITIIYILSSLFFLSAAIYGVVIYSNNSSLNDKFSSIWYGLSVQTQLYYYNNSIENLIYSYKYKMIVTFSFNFMYFLMCLLIAFLANRHNDNVLYEWRPALKARISDERALNYIRIYDKYYPEFEKKKKSLIKVERKETELKLKLKNNEIANNKLAKPVSNKMILHNSKSKEDNNVKDIQANSSRINIINDSKGLPSFGNLPNKNENKSTTNNLKSDLENSNKEYNKKYSIDNFSNNNNNTNDKVNLKNDNYSSDKDDNTVVNDNLDCLDDINKKKSVELINDANSNEEKGLNTKKNNIKKPTRRLLSSKNKF